MQENSDGMFHVIKYPLNQSTATQTKISKAMLLRITIYKNDQIKECKFKVVHIVKNDGLCLKYVDNRGPYQYKDSLSMHDDFHYKDTTVVIPILVRRYFYIDNEIDPSSLDTAILWGLKIFRRA